VKALLWWVSCTGIFIGLGIIPVLWPNDSVVSFLSIIMIWGIFATAFDLVYSRVGLLSVGHAAFFGGGGYVFALLVMNADWPFFLALFAGGLLAGALAAVFSIVALRLSGLFFALVTLALAELLRAIALTRLKDWTGGYDGIPGVPRPLLLGIDFLDNRNFYYLTLVAFTIAIGFVGLLRASPFGRAALAVRLNEIRAMQLGFNVKAIKVAVFAVSGFLTGIAGGLLFSLLLYANPDAMNWPTSGDVVIMTLLGGTGTLFGPLLGVTVFESLRYWLSGLTIHWLGIVGVLFIAATIFLPEGLAGFSQKIWRKLSS
jgi:branched-chain amino acid transport system permease protein